MGAGVVVHPVVMKAFLRPHEIDEMGGELFQIVPQAGLVFVDAQAARRVRDGQHGETAPDPGSRQRLPALRRDVHDRDPGGGLYVHRRVRDLHGTVPPRTRGYLAPPTRKVAPSVASIEKNGWPGRT